MRSSLNNRSSVSYCKAACVLFQYFVATKLDQVFHEFLIDVVADEFMPPNPYPKLASQLAVAATR